MPDRSEKIFGNSISKKAVKKAERSKQGFIRKFGDDSMEDYPVRLVPNQCLEKPLGVYDVRVAEGEGDIPFDLGKGIIVGNIRMGFGHYRISIAMASAAHALGYSPYWMDLNSFKDTTCTKVISSQNDLYSMGSRLSQKSRVFNRTVWEPLNYEGFRRLTYNSSDQKNAELMAPVFRNIPKELPVIGTHVWPAQAAVHAGMKYVVNAIPDNWPMALHLAEGSVHTVQTHQSYMGYRILNGMSGEKVLRPMPADGGAGAQRELFASMIRHLLPAIRKQKAALYVNVGDYRQVWEELKAEVKGLSEISTEHFDNWEDTQSFSELALDKRIDGVHAFCHSNIFEAVYCTNLLLRSTDVLVTKPSELAFYPVPKLFLKRIGGHERWGAIHSAEMGDGTLECQDVSHTIQMTDLFMRDDTLLEMMCDCIRQNNTVGLYDGAYNAVRLAMKLKDKE